MNARAGVPLLLLLAALLAGERALERAPSATPVPEALPPVTSAAVATPAHRPPQTVAARSAARADAMKRDEGGAAAVPSSDRAARATASSSQPTPQPAAASALPAATPQAAPRHAQAEAIAAALAAEDVEETVAPLARLYFAYFDRAPDHEGLTYYIGERATGEPLAAIADEFAGSPEFESRYGRLGAAGFVDLVFANVFGVPGDEAQRAWWTAQLESGAMTRGQVMLAFSEGATFATLTANEVFVTLAYAETLRAAPEPAELARWVALLDAGHPRRVVIDGLLALRGGR